MLKELKNAEEIK